MPASADPRADRCAEAARFREFVDRVVTPRAAGIDQDGAVPSEVVRSLAAEGYLGAGVAVEHGGGGFDAVRLGILYEEVGRGCSSVRTLLTVHGMVASAVERWGTGVQRADLLPRLARGEVIGVFALSEEAAGSDPTTVRTTAEPVPDGYVLTGTKRWISMALIADVLLVFARTPGGITAFLVPRDTPGLRVAPIDGVLGTRGGLMGEVQLEGCRVPAGAVLGPVDRGFMTVAAVALELGRYSVACGCVGIAQACLDASMNHTAHRWQGGAFIKDHQLIRRLLTDMATEVAAARLLCRQAGALRAGNDLAAPMATWMAKYFAAAAANRAARETVQIHGAAGCFDGHPAARYLRDAKVMEIIEGSTQIQQVVIADLVRQERHRLPDLAEALMSVGR
ncbi:acyl-CoA dehydrogenase family protein [Kibdelosporangium persicum]|uniref:Acyl-CoA dehydrogenase, short-chain specific n=1 Tax=Kibdelosporangium persicum TaxID=2698649 RepID=A0ABX2FG64_9PSEU|nr:acyl-CoA dehydrogenase family protein [Kibdelosporangium persicum]NRN70391.1 Acyl-CoA dehydrogenase, short-chain specific [Kibdelosporangium persicum]